MVARSVSAVRRLLASSFTSPDPRTRTTAWVAAGLFTSACLVAAGLGGLVGVPGSHRVVVPAPASTEEAAPTTIVETRYVDDPVYVVDTTVPPVGEPSAAVTPPAAGASAALPAEPGATASAPTVAAAPAAGGSTGGPGPAVAPSGSDSDGDDEPAPTPTTVLPAVPATTTTTLPAGARIPDDWPPGKPIPPIPPGCRKPVLEDDGKWNCDH